MSPVELRASASLASIFGPRLLGMFIILPVFAIYAEQLPGGSDLTLVGIAIGAYGLTQAVLQIPFVWWSDKYFNVLEAMLPSLTSRLAPPESKGVAIGLYSSVQFFGTFSARR